MQPIRLLLMIMLLALLPLQAWAGLVTSASVIGLVQAQPGVTIATDHMEVAADQADFATPAAPEASCPSDNAEPSPAGADLAEQLLPAPLPRVMTSTARSSVPRYAAASLPEPDLPLLPRPPRD